MSVAAFLRTLYVLALALWVGAAVFFSVVVLPVLFTSMEPARAGEIAALLFPYYFRFGAALGVLLLAAALRPNPAQAGLAATVQRHASAVFAEPIRLSASPLYTDARHYGEAGLPVVLYGAGPRTLLQANAKRADENILLADLRRATIVIARVLLDLLGADRTCAMRA